MGATVMFVITETHFLVMVMAGLFLYLED